MNDKKDKPVSECLYCNKKMPMSGSVRPHLRLHSNMRPYKCKLCHYKHWTKTQISNTHIVMVHGRKGTLEDVETNIEEEKEMERKIEDEAAEIRDNLARARQGLPNGPKKKPDREAGAVNHRNRYPDFPGVLPGEEKKPNESTNNNAGGGNSQANGYGNYGNNVQVPYQYPVQNNNIGGQNHTTYNYNNAIQPPYQNQVQQSYNHVPDHLKDLSLDNLLNNNF